MNQPFVSELHKWQGEIKMSSEQEVDRGGPLLLRSEDRANGFSIVADDCHNIMLFKWDKLDALFSAVVTEETLNAFLELVKDSERSERGM